VKANIPSALEEESDLLEYLAQQKSLVDGRLDQFLPSADTYPEIIHEAMRYSVFAGGKRVRPILVLACGEALEGDPERLLYLASAVEMIHTYSLIHDDLPAMDDDDYRRGHLTAHKKFGEAVAILAGNALLTRAVETLTQIPGPSQDHSTKLKVIRQICEAVGTINGMLAGQVMDCVSQGKPFSGDQLEQIHAAKTGALITACISTSALLSGASQNDYDRLCAFGKDVGLVFQIVDDILDIEASMEESGKTAGKDDQSCKATYPRMYGLERSRKMAKELTDQAIQEVEFLGSKGARLKQLSRYIQSRRS